MSLTSFIVFRNWASSRLRVLLTLVGIALGVAIVVAIYVMDHNTIQSRMIAQDPQRGWVDLEVHPVDTTRAAADVRAELRARDGIADAAIWREARGVAAGPQKPLPLSVFGLAPLPANAFAHYVVNRGRDLVAEDITADAPGILLGGEAAHLLGVDVGDVMTLGEPPPSQRVECKDGQLTPIPVPVGTVPFSTKVMVVGVLEHQKLGKRAAGLVAVTSLNLAEKLRPVGGNLFHILREQGADLDRLRQELQSDYAVVDARGAMIGEGADERAFRNGLKILGGLALLLGMFVVFQTLSHSLIARVRQLGLLRCLGTGTGAITRIFLLDALMLGVVGSVIGVALGLLLALWLQAQRVSSLGLGKEWATFDIPWFPVLWTAALGLLFTLAGAMFPLMRARQIPALDILRARGLAPGNDDGVDLMKGVHVWMFGLLVLALPLAYLAMTPLVVEEGQETRMVLLELGAMLGLFGGVLLLAPSMTTLLGRAMLLPFRPFSTMATWLVDKCLKRSSGRVSAAVCGLSAVLLALLGLKSLTGSLQAEVHVFGEAALRNVLFLQCEPTSALTAQKLASVEGVRQVEAYEGEVRSAGFLLRGLSVESAAGRGGPLEGSQVAVHRYVDERDRTLIVSKRLAKARDWQPGSLVPLRDKNGTPVSYEVLLVDDRAGFDSDERAFAITSPHWLRKDFCIGELCVELVTLRMDRLADLEIVRAAARATLPNVYRSKTGASVEDYLHRDVEKDFYLFDLLLFLMMGLAGVGLLNGMTIAALGRQRELGVLRALGIKRGALGGSFLIEGAIVAAIASVLSVALSYPLGIVLVLGMNAVAQIDAPVTMPWMWLILAPIAAFATAILASLVPAYRALKQSPSESVRYE